MDSTTHGPDKTHKLSFYRIPGSDWFLVIAFFLALVILGPIAISAGYIVAGFLMFFAVSFLPAYFWLRPRRR
jgi:hypothetical protein